MNKKYLFLLLIAMLAPGVTMAQDRSYFGVSMFNSNYDDKIAIHRSSGLMARLGYDMSKHFAVETHFGGTIGSESNPDTINGQAHFDNIYALFLRLNSHIKTYRLYALVGQSYGDRLVRLPGAAGFTKDTDSNKSFGLGLEIFGNEDLSFDLQLMRYFDNHNYTLSAFNLGLLTRF